MRRWALVLIAVQPADSSLFSSIFSKPASAAPASSPTAHRSRRPPQEPPPTSSGEFAALVPTWWRKNATLYDYYLGVGGDGRRLDVTKHWAPQTEHCVHSDNCYCYHVKGSQDKTYNPHGSDYCERLHDPKGRAEYRQLKISNCTKRELRLPCKTTCTVGRDKPCLHTLMGPAKQLSLFAIARAAGITHVVEEGREGGLTAYMWWLHGFNTTSIEYLPQDEVTAALHLLSPSMSVLDGDGHTLVPRYIDSLPKRVAARTMVIFDGEKRGTAYRDTYLLIRDRIAVGVFDDSDVGVDLRRGKPAPFHKILEEHREVWRHRAPRAHTPCAPIPACPRCSQSAHHSRCCVVAVCNRCGGRATRATRSTRSSTTRRRRPSTSSSPTARSGAPGRPPASGRTLPSSAARGAPNKYGCKVERASASAVRLNVGTVAFLGQRAQVQAGAVCGERVARVGRFASTPL